MGKTQQAINYLKKAISIASDLYPEKDDFIAELYFHHGAMSFEFGEEETGRKCIEASLNSYGKKNYQYRLASENTYILTAARYGYLALIKWLLKNKHSTLDERNISGNTPLLEASYMLLKD